MLRLVDESYNLDQTILEAEIIANEDDLPPPIPNEAKMSWLSTMATVKAELPKSESHKVIGEKAKPVNAWANLPDNALNRFTQARINNGGLAYTPNYKFMLSRFNSRCYECRDIIEEGDLICYLTNAKRAVCSNCDTFRANNVERMAHGLPDARAMIV
jgi:hypothetical protein